MGEEDGTVVYWEDDSCMKLNLLLAFEMKI
jgi:hypothetical protein